MKATVYWIPKTPTGRLAIMPRPRAGDWLEDEINAWKKAGITAVVSLLTPLEIWELQLQNEPLECQKNQIKFVSFSIQDRHVPDSVTDVRELVSNITADLKHQQQVAIHCRMGVGRSAMLAACVLCQHGYTSDQAFHLIAQGRGLPVPDTDEQRRWAAHYFCPERCGR